MLEPYCRTLAAIGVGKICPKAETLVSSNYAEILGTLPDHYWERMAAEVGFHPLNSAALPLLLFGDECQCQNTNFMVVTWQSEVCPKSSDAMFSRHVITMFPSSEYYIEEESGTNVTLQTAMGIIVQSLNFLAEHGVGQPKLFAQCIGIKGDWKWHRQCCNLVRHYGVNSVCYMCPATKNLVDPLTNLSPNAHWRGQIHNPANPPWEVEPAVASLHGWATWFVLPDLLHVWHLGIGRDVVAGCLLILLRKRGPEAYFRGASLQLRMADATQCLRSWASRNKELLPRKFKITKAKLNWKSGEFATFKAKGAVVALFVRWLYDLLNERDCGNHLLHSCVWAAGHSVGMLSKAKRKSCFLEPAEKEQIHTVGTLFIHCYLLLHRAGSGCARVGVFNPRPKIHLLHHMFLLPCGSKNPATAQCFMDEDFLKKLMQIARRTHTLTAPFSTLRRWLLGLKEKYDSVLLELSVCAQADGES